MAKTKNMNLITKPDVDKFLKLLKAGLQHGKERNMTTFASTNNFAETNVAKDHFIHLELCFKLDDEIMRDIFIEEDFEIGNQIDELLK